MREKQRFEKLYKSLIIDDKLMYAAFLLERAARLWPKKIALIFEENTITFKELFNQTLKVSQFLIERGLKPRDRIIILSENSAHFYHAYYGAWQIGCVVVPVNNFLHNYQIDLIIQHAEPKAIFVSRQLEEKIKTISSSIITITETDIEHALETESKIPPELVSLDEDEPSVILYTSGTTGNAKGVMLSSKNILVNCAQGCSQSLIEYEERALAALPLFHSYMQNTCLWSAFFVGAAVIIVPKIDRRLLIEGLRHRPTIVLGIPQMYGLFCLMRDAPFSSVRYFVSGGDVLPAKIKMAFELIYRRKICNGYGLTETSPFLSVQIDDTAGPIDLVGSPLPEIEFQIRSEDNVVLPQGSRGVLWVRGDNVMLGYFNEPEKTAAVLVDGWLNTGDIGHITREGKLVLSGREKDLIKNKGIKVYPQEIENILMLHPLIIGAAVVGQPDESGEIPIAFVASRDVKAPHLVKELQELCTQHLASYEIPRSFIIRDKLPMTATGKIDKKVLRAELHDNL